MYKVFREGGPVEPPRRAQVDTLNNGDTLGFTNGLSQVEVSLKGHRLAITQLKGKPVEIKIDPPLIGAAMVEQTLGGLRHPRTISTLRRNVVIQSKGGEHKLVLIRNTPLVRK